MALASPEAVTCVRLTSIDIGQATGSAETPPVMSSFTGRVRIVRLPSAGVACARYLIIGLLIRVA
jgi:hypothetical protein